MAAKYILTALGLVFLLAAVVRMRTLGGRHPQVRTWWLIAAIFLGVGGWLFTRG